MTTWLVRQGAPQPMASERYKIKITTESGRELYWVKRGQVHTLSRDLAEIWVKNFKPAIFQVTPDGELAPPSPGVTTFPIARVEMEPDT
jgi:hypothetical protein